MKTDMNIFEQASRANLHLDTNRGALTFSELWSVPLTSKQGFSLDAIARSVNSELKELSEESFVAVKSNPAKAELELKLEVVKHIIASRMAENEDKLRADSKAEERKKLLMLLDKKKESELENLSVGEIESRIAELTS